MEYSAGMVSQVFAFVETKKTAELLTLISIMLTDKLFFEFVHEVYREKIILGEKTIDVFRNKFVAKFEELLVSAFPKVKKRKNISISNVAGARTYTIETEDDIDQFAEEIKRKLKEQLDGDTIIVLS